jgi:replicative superfamily II helicase
MPADPKLRELAEVGVAFHHAGLESADRTKVESLFLNGHINMIVSTSVRPEYRTYEAKRRRWPLV